MNLSLHGIRACHDMWSVSAEGTFGAGIHLVSGRIGSGKTTLALMIAGLREPEEGTIDRAGIASSAIVFQDPEFHVTGHDLLHECRSWGGDPAAILSETGLSGKELTDPLDLSRGELKRLILACVLSRDPDLLVLDEPFSSLDCGEKERLCERLSRRDHGITIIFTHEHSFFPRVDRIWEILNGSLHDRGPVPSALSRWELAPVLIRELIAAGRTPKNLTPEDLGEALCRT